MAWRFVGHHGVHVLNIDTTVGGAGIYCGGERERRCRMNRGEVRDFPMRKYVMHE